MDASGARGRCGNARTKDTRRRRRRGDGSLEERIGYRFKDTALFDSALSHISR